jgi:hypothetical protein
LEEFPGYGGDNSKSSDFAATIINQFAGAGTQNAFTSGATDPTLINADLISVAPFTRPKG